LIKEEIVMFSKEDVRFPAEAWPNNALQLTAYSVRSCVAPASGRS
jgi:hypothetical protein